MDIFELKNYIRFQLAKLSVKNAHHEFEQLAYEVARLRVATNLLPNTGPVSAGGDQGRDFESFRTFLAESFPGSSSFAAETSEGQVIVGVCTLEKDPVGKLRRDLEIIFAGGQRPDHIAYFCETDIVTSKQHELQALCKNKYDATLDIFDGNRLKELLVEWDTVWIAERFLSIPSEYFPQGKFPARYQELYERWIAHGVRPIQTFADFIEVREGLRLARKAEEAKAHQRTWLSLMESLIDDGTSGGVSGRARYEVFIANLRGLGTPEPALGHFSAIPC